MMSKPWNVIYFKPLFDANGQPLMDASTGKQRSHAIQCGVAFMHPAGETNSGKPRVDIILDVMPPLGVTLSAFTRTPKPDPTTPDVPQDATTSDTLEKPGSEVPAAT